MKKCVDKYCEDTYNINRMPAEPLHCMLNTGGFFYLRGIFDGINDARMSFICTYSMFRSTRSSILTFIRSPIFNLEHPCTKTVTRQLKAVKQSQKLEDENFFSLKIS
jgi:hypothetical protein